MLKPMLLRAIAAGRSERGTISPTSDCQAGPLNAVPQPTRKVKASRSQGVTRPKEVHTVKATDTASRKSCEVSMSLRRSKLSAMAPAMSENSMIGSVVEACTRAMRSADAPIEVISQAAPTDWINPPKLEARLAIQTARKMRCRKGAKADVGLSNPSASCSGMENLR
jgi:hypothetical protein